MRAIDAAHGDVPRCRCRWSAHWTLRGRPLSFVRFVEDWEPVGDPPAYPGLYEASLAAEESVTAAATIEVERIAGKVVPRADAALGRRAWPHVVAALGLREQAAGDP